MKFRIENKFLYITEASPEEIAWLDKKLTWEDEYADTSEKLLYKTEDGNYYTFWGIFNLLKNHISCPYDLELENPPSIDIESIEVGADILDNITLMDFQIAAVKKSLIFKRGILSCPTGCFTGDTKISLLDGTETEIKDLLEKEEFWVYSCKPDGTIVPGRGHSARITKYVDSLYEITLDNGEVIRCTDNHPFMMRDGSYKKAEELRENDSLMPLYYKREQDLWYRDKRPAVRDNKSGIWVPVHKMVGNYLYGDHEITHHKDENIFNNIPSNLEAMTKFEHDSYHSRKTRYKKLIPYFTNKEHQSNAAVKAGKISGKSNITKYNKSEKGRTESVNRAAHMRSLLNNKSKEEKKLARLKQSLGAFKRNCKVRHNSDPSVCQLCNINYDKILQEVLYLDSKYNHKVISIKIVNSPNTPVYDITVDKYHNFALSAGVFVHNSGKTEMILAVLRYLLDNKKVKNVVIVVPSVGLADQLLERAINRGFSTEEISALHSNSKFRGTPIVVGVVNSLNIALDKNGEAANFIKNTDCLIYDESHHGKANSYVRLALDTNPKYLLYYSGSPFSERLITETAGDVLLFGLAGNVIYSITQKYLRTIGLIAEPILFYKTIPGRMSKYPGKYNDIYNNQIVKNTPRNQVIANYTNKFINLGFKTLILVQRIEHAKALMLMLKDQKVTCIFGGSTGLQIDEFGMIEEYSVDYNMFRNNFASGLYDIVIMSQVGDEGFDIPAIGAVILAGGGKSRIKLLQRVGRGLRRKKIGPNRVYILDFEDKTHIYLQSQYRKRKALMEEVEATIITNESEFLNLAIEHSKELTILI